METQQNIENKINEAKLIIEDSCCKINNNLEIIRDYKIAVGIGYATVLVIGGLIILPLTINDLISISTTIKSLGTVLFMDVAGLGFCAVIYKRHSKTLKNDIAGNKNIIDEKQLEIFNLNEELKSIKQKKLTLTRNN